MGDPGDVTHNRGARRLAEVTTRKERSCRKHRPLLPRPKPKPKHPANPVTYCRWSTSRSRPPLSRADFGVAWRGPSPWASWTRRSASSWARASSWPATVRRASRRPPARTGVGTPRAKAVTLTRFPTPGRQSARADPALRKLPRPSGLPAVRTRQPRAARHLEGTFRGRLTLQLLKRCARGHLRPAQRDRLCQAGSAAPGTGPLRQTSECSLARIVSANGTSGPSEERPQGRSTIWAPRAPGVLGAHHAAAGAVRESASRPLQSGLGASDCGTCTSRPDLG
jgi:hypothetical protein